MDLRISRNVILSLSEVLFSLKSLECSSEIDNQVLLLGTSQFVPI